jgi:hypothetical protein
MDTFEARQASVDSFKKELTALVRKYRFGARGVDDYNGEEENCGTDYFFKINGEIYAAETIEEILKACFWDQLGPIQTY